MPSDSPAVFVFVWGGPTFRLMRGHIVGPAFRCLSGCRAQPSGLLRHAGGSLIYFMAITPVVRSLGRQWPPIEAALECRSWPRCLTTSARSHTNSWPGSAFFMGRRHSDAASFEVIGPVTYPATFRPAKSRHAHRGRLSFRWLEDAGVQRLLGWLPHRADPPLSRLRHQFGGLRAKDQSGALS